MENKTRFSSFPLNLNEKNHYLTYCTDNVMERENKKGFVGVTPPIVVVKKLFPSVSANKF